MIKGFLAGFFAFIISLISCIFFILITGDISGIISYNANSIDKGFFTVAIDFFVFTYLILVTIFFYRAFTNNNNFGNNFLRNLKKSIFYLIFLFIVGYFLSVFIENIIYGDGVNRGYSSEDWYLDWITYGSFWIFCIVIILTIIYSVVNSTNLVSDKDHKNTADLNFVDKNEKDSLKVVQKEVKINKSEPEPTLDLTKKDALKKLTEQKELLDLEVITQEEYNKVKDELKSIIIRED